MPRGIENLETKSAYIEAVYNDGFNTYGDPVHMSLSVLEIAANYYFNDPPHSIDVTAELMTHDLQAEGYTNIKFTHSDIFNLFKKNDIQIRTQEDARQVKRPSRRSKEFFIESLYREGIVKTNKTEITETIIVDFSCEDIITSLYYNDPPHSARDIAILLNEDLEAAGSEEKLSNEFVNRLLRKKGHILRTKQEAIKAYRENTPPETFQAWLEASKEARSQENKEKRP